MFLALIVGATALLGWGIPDGVECAAFGPTTTPEERAETLQKCHDFFEFYDYEEPDYGTTFISDCWKQYDAGFVSACDDGGSTYVVSDGDLSLWTISQRLGISFGALLDAYQGDNPDLIRVGDSINLP